MKRSLLLLTTALVLSGCNENTKDINWFDALKTLFTGEIPQKYLIDNMSAETRQLYEEQYAARTATGSYLSGRFAQSNFDWEVASNYFSEVLITDPKDIELKRRAMVLSMGAGQYQNAFDYARTVILTGKDNGSLPQLFVALETFKSGNYAQIVTDLQKIPDDGISEFVKPLFTAWAKAGLGKTEITGLNKNIVHYYHAILIADYTKNMPVLKDLAMRDYSRLGLSNKSLKQIANIFEKNGLTAQAHEVLRAIPASAINDMEPTSNPIENPVQGMSRALFDMSSVLYQDYPDSARLFAEMSLYLDPAQNDSRILMAHMAAQFKRYDEAIALFNEIDVSKDPALRIKLQRQIADLFVSAGKTDQAIEILRKVVDKTKDVEAQIQIGDIYREQENFPKALHEYDKAFDLLGNVVTAKNWNLLYARGITNERLKNWDDAEKDLKSALALEPDHPYILNYLGYSWIDHGKNLEEATRMIEKAVRLRPEDGYIVDSLGWAYYKQGKYIEAAQMLERAIALLANDPTINDHLGDAYWQVGRKSEARFQWQRALNFQPDADLEKQLQEKMENGITQNPVPVSAKQANSFFKKD